MRNYRKEHGEEAMTDKLVNQMIKLQVIDDDEKEIYRFGIESLLLKILHYSSYLLIAAFSNEVVRFLIFFLTFLVLRKSAGGYHAKSKAGCYCISCFTVLSAIISMKILSNYENNLEVLAPVFLLTILCDVIIVRFAPLGNRNRELEEAETRYFRKRTRMVLCGENILVFLFVFLKLEGYAIGIVLAILCQAVLLLLEKRNETENKGAVKNAEQNL